MNIPYSFNDLLKEKPSNRFSEVATFRDILIEFTGFSKFLNDDIHNLFALTVVVKNLSLWYELNNLNNIGVGLQLHDSSHFLKDILDVFPI